MNIDLPLFNPETLGEGFVLQYIDCIQKFISHYHQDGCRDFDVDLEKWNASIVYHIEPSRTCLRFENDELATLFFLHFS